MSENDVGILFAKLLVVENEIKNISQNLKDYQFEHAEDAKNRHNFICKSIDIIVDKFECQTKRCFNHAPIIDGFGKHIQEHEELSKEKRSKETTFILAVGGWVIAIFSVYFGFILRH